MQRRSCASVRRDAPPQDSVLDALRAWVAELRATHPETVRVGLFGSYARGDYLPSSDADVFVEVGNSPHERWFDRPVEFPYPSDAPVPVELFIYTSAEIARMEREDSRWLARIVGEAIWL